MHHVAFPAAGLAHEEHAAVQRVHAHAHRAPFRVHAQDGTVAPVQLVGHDRQRAHRRVAPARRGRQGGQRAARQRQRGPLESVRVDAALPVRPVRVLIVARHPGLQVGGARPSSARTPPVMAGPLGQIVHGIMDQTPADRRPRRHGEHGQRHGHEPAGRHGREHDGRHGHGRQEEHAQEEPQAGTAHMRGQARHQAQVQRVRRPLRLIHRRTRIRAARHHTARAQPLAPELRRVRLHVVLVAQPIRQAARLDPAEPAHVHHDHRVLARIQAGTLHARLPVARRTRQGRADRHERVRPHAGAVQHVRPPARADRRVRRTRRQFARLLPIPVGHLHPTAFPGRHQTAPVVMPPPVQPSGTRRQADRVGHGLRVTLEPHIVIRLIRARRGNQFEPHAPPLCPGTHTRA